jgi:hypothetical protein
MTRKIDSAAPGVTCGNAVLVTGSRVPVSYRDSPWIAVVCGTYVARRIPQELEPPPLLVIVAVHPPGGELGTRRLMPS